MKRVAVAAVAAVLLLGCGDGDDRRVQPDPYGYGTLEDGRLSFCADPAYAEDLDCAKDDR